MVGTLALVMLVGRAMVGPLFAQSAWNNVTFTADEVDNPGRNLPRALLIGCASVVATSEELPESTHHSGQLS